MTITLRGALKAALLAAMCTGATSAASAEYPEQRIKVLISSKAGSGTDTLGRIVLDAIHREHGWDFVPQNKEGGGGLVLGRELAHADPDGYTLGIMTTLGTGYTLVEKAETAGFDMDDFDYLGTIAQFQMALVSQADKGWTSVDDMVDYAKEHGSLKIGHMSPKLAVLSKAIGDHYGFKVEAVPTNGGREVMNLLLGGHIDAGWSGGIHQQYVESGDLSVVLAGQSDRLKNAPDAPTLTELGIDLDGGGFFSVIAPAGLPQDVKAELSTALCAAVESPEVQELIEKKMLLVPNCLSPEAHRDYVEKRNAEARRILAKE